MIGDNRGSRKFRFCTTSVQATPLKLTLTRFHNNQSSRPCKRRVRFASGGTTLSYGTGYEPRNSKEKWLMRIVCWGTALLVAFLWWEYVKAR